MLTNESDPQLNGISCGMVFSDYVPDARRRAHHRHRPTPAG
jgi:hypothetical protein